LPVKNAIYQKTRSFKADGVGFDAGRVSGDDDKALRQSTISSGAQSGALLPDFTADGAPADVDLALIVERWPRLPDDVRRAIVSMVEADDGRRV
jgi:hypothetical protein